MQYSINQFLEQQNIIPYGDVWEQLEGEFKDEYEKFVKVLADIEEKNEDADKEYADKLSDELVTLFNELHEIEIIEVPAKKQSAAENPETEAIKKADVKQETKETTEKTAKEKQPEQQKTNDKPEEKPVKETESGNNEFYQYLSQKKQKRVDISGLLKFFGNDIKQKCFNNGTPCDFEHENYKFIAISSDIVPKGMFKIWDVFKMKKDE